MKCCVILILFGVAAQLNASAIQPANVSEDGDSIRVSRSAEGGAEDEGSVDTVDSKLDTEESEIDSAMSRRSDAGSVDSKRDTEESEIDSAMSRRSNEGSVDSKRDSEESEIDSAMSRRSNEGGSLVLALGLDTGVVETKNSFVESISRAFSGLTQSQHSRSNKDDKKLKPLALELRSDAILHGVENFLASPKVKKFTNDMARKAAVMYRAIEKVFS